MSYNPRESLFAQVRDDAGAVGARDGQQRPQPPLEPWVVAGTGVGFAGTQAWHQRTLGKAFEGNGMHRAGGSQRHGRIDAVARKARPAGDDAMVSIGCGHERLQNHEVQGVVGPIKNSSRRVCRARPQTPRGIYDWAISD